MMMPSIDRKMHENNAAKNEYKTKANDNINNNNNNNNNNNKINNASIPIAHRKHSTRLYRSINSCRC
jgi:hypothetical protein